MQLLLPECGKCQEVKAQASLLLVVPSSAESQGELSLSVQRLNQSHVACLSTKSFFLLVSKWCERERVAQMPAPKTEEVTDGFRRERSGDRYPQRILDRDRREGPEMASRSCTSFSPLYEYIIKA